MDLRNKHVGCNFLACDRTEVMGHNKDYDKHPDYVPPTKGTNRQNHDEMDNDNNDDKAPIPPPAPAPAPAPAHRISARNRAGPSNQQPKVRNSQKFYPARRSHHPAHLVVLRNGKFSKPENFPGWGFHDVVAAAERGYKEFLQRPDLQWEDSGRMANRADLASGALAAEVPESESFGESINVSRGRTATRSYAEADSQPHHSRGITDDADPVVAAAEEEITHRCPSPVPLSPPTSPPTSPPDQEHRREHLPEHHRSNLSTT